MLPARLKRLFLARSTILVLVVLALAAMLVGCLVPQSFMISASDLAIWQSRHPYLGAATRALGLHAVFSQPLFALVLFCMALSLFFSCLEQFKGAWGRSFHPGAVRGETVATGLDDKAIRERLIRLGYRPVGGEGVRCFARQRVGHWGNFLLHLGMLVAILSSLLIALTQQRGVLHLAERESFMPGERWISTEKGVLAREFALPGPVRLESVRFRHGRNHGLEDLRSRLSFVEQNGSRGDREVGVNRLAHLQGVRVYQTLDFGHAFYLEIAPDRPDRAATLVAASGPSFDAGRGGGAGGAAAVYQLLLSHPDRPDQPSYRDFPDLPVPGKTLRLKYLIDGNGGAFDAAQPELTLRMDRLGAESGRATLWPGSEARIDAYRVRLLRVDRWSGLIFVRLTGIPGVFAGFFLLILGGVLNYFTAPREVSLQQGRGGEWLVSWRALRFEDFYLEEFQQLEAALAREER